MSETKQENRSTQKCDEPRMKNCGNLKLPGFGWIIAVWITFAVLQIGLMGVLIWRSQMTAFFWSAYFTTLFFVSTIAWVSVLAQRSISLSYLEVQRKSIEASSQADTTRHELDTAERESERQRFLDLVREVVKILINAKMENAQNAVGHRFCR